jgi:hypothetical protein
MSAAVIQELNQFASSQPMVVAAYADDRWLDQLAPMNLVGTIAWSCGGH